MPIRTRKLWRPDARGNFTRQIGWTLTSRGTITQPKFNLGSDKNEAKRREKILRSLWLQAEEASETPDPVWPDELLVVAKAVAGGTESIEISRLPNEEPATFAKRFLETKAQYPGTIFTPSDPGALKIGSAVLARTGVEIRRPDQTRNVFNEEIKSEAASQEEPRQALEQTQSQNNQADEVDEVETEINEASPTQKLTTCDGPTLYDAFESFQDFLGEEFYRPEIGLVTAWGQTQIRQMNTLKQHFQDRPITDLDGDGINSLFSYWRRRPCKLGTSVPMTQKSASNYIKVLKRFFKWLDQSSKYKWRKPFAFNDIETRIQTLTSDYANRRLVQVDTFSIDELKLMMRYGQPLDRLMVLLALNCGFGRAEIASLLCREVRLFQGHEDFECEILNYRTTNEDSFIKRVRRKSGVYGEHWLYPITVEGLQWAIENRKKIDDPPYSDNAVLLLNAKGNPYDQPTRSNNANQAIPNRFDRLLKRIKDDGNEIRKLSFGKLRKTATQLIKTHSDGEIAGVFDCHGQPVRSDALSDKYSNRPFGKVFEACKSVHKYLRPVLRQAGPQPFAKQAEAYTQRKTIDKIIRLHLDGVFAGQIASVVRLHGSTVARHITDFERQRKGRAQ